MVLEATLRQGYRVASDQLPIRPQIECPHYGRLRILKEIQAGVSKSYESWLNIKDVQMFVLQSPPEETLRDMLRLNAHPVIARIEIGLSSQRDRCTVCCFRDIKKRPAPRPVEPADAQMVPHELDISNRVLLPAHLKENKYMENAICRDMAPTRAPRTPTHAMPLPVQAFVCLPISRFRDFDEWFQGPVLEDIHILERPGGIDHIHLESYSRPTVYSSWEEYKDYGYRLQRDFALMFNTDEPLGAVEHLLPLPGLYLQAADQYEEDEEDGSPEGTPQLSDLFSSDPMELVEDEVQVQPRETTPIFVGGYTPVGTSGDCVKMSMNQMLTDAGPRGSISAMNMFVGGILPDGRKIELDLTADIRPLAPDDFELSIDIDSVIWTTHLLKAKAEVLVHVLPYNASRAPIHKSNHTFVHILMPQSQRDRDGGGRTEWFTTQVSVSTIPHIPFAKIPSGATTFNIYVFFPRMMHRDPVTGRRKTLIPFEIQALWLTDVVYPAIKMCEDITMEAYTSYTLDEWIWKAELDGRFSNKTRTVPVKEGLLDKLQDSMKRIVASEDYLAMLGSFFFVLDGRGMKHTTSTNVRIETDPYLELLERFSVLDWEYMMLRENGQLLVDLGMGFHPNPASKEALVALWHLETLKDSFGMAGMNAGTTHYLNTLSGYGGRQAEMAATRQRIVQLSFRSAYGLYYQPVRRGRGGDVKFCSETDACDVNASFTSSIESYIKIFKGSASKSFGGRDEMRGSGVAIKMVMQEAPKLVRDFRGCHLLAMC